MRRWVLLLSLILVVTVGGILLTRAYVLAAPEQPIDFSHRTHVDAGVGCLYCHSSALRSNIAGIPSLEKCMGCHAVIATDNPTVQEVRGYFERGEPIPWMEVNIQPDFVFFSHQPHLSARINCEYCHGEVGQMESARAVVNMDMGWCLDCHLLQPEENVERLADCITCHK